MHAPVDAHPLPGFLTVQPDGVTLAVKVTPRAPHNEIGEASGTELRVKVTAPPVDAAANEALIRLLAEKWIAREVQCGSCAGRPHGIKSSSSAEFPRRLSWRNCPALDSYSYS